MRRRRENAIETVKLRLNGGKCKKERRPQASAAANFEVKNE